MEHDQLAKEAVLRIGEVTEVDGHRVVARVDKNKNVSDLLFDGSVLRNISVGSYVEIRKGFASLIGKVDGERLEESPLVDADGVRLTDRNVRYLDISLSGFIDRTGKFRGGLREMPLVGNEVLIATKEVIEVVHNLVEGERRSVVFSKTDVEGFEIAFPIDGLFNSHIAIFGNTGSGKSNTLARLYSAFVSALRAQNERAFKETVHIVLLDFNGEYNKPGCITDAKEVLRMSTSDDSGDRIPLHQDALIDIEMLSILAEATDKTQKPLLKRAIREFRRVFSKNNPDTYFRAALQKQIEFALLLGDKVRAEACIEYARTILTNDIDADSDSLRADIEWHHQQGGFRILREQKLLNEQPDAYKRTAIWQAAENFSFEEATISRVIKVVYFQLMQDLLTNRAINEHVSPVIARLASKRHEIERIFDVTATSDFWARSNVVVVNLNEASLEMKKTVPLLLCKKLYTDHKRRRAGALVIIIDEAHNILSTESAREAESWKDYRLETFEEIIKEGRKFGVFVTISSQRPNDISHTITSQAHNYFIHRLVNHRDLEMVSKAVSYIDRVSEASIPTLPTGTCIFSGVAGQMPLKLRVTPLPEDEQPSSMTLRFDNLMSRR